MSLRSLLAAFPRKAVAPCCLALAVASTSVLSACLPGVLTLSARQAGSGKPGNVAVRFTVNGKDGATVPRLTVDQFIVYEDGEKVAASDSKQTLLSPPGAAANEYLFSYCSPARAGMHEARIEAHSPDGSMGYVAYHFDADGFGSGCDPSNPIGFVMSRAPEPSSPEPKEGAAPKPPKKPHVAPTPPPPSAPTPKPPPTSHPTPAPRPTPAPTPPPAPEPTPPPAPAQPSDPFAP